jgi:tRNA modification GTPase
MTATMNGTDTIFALSSGAPPAGIAVVRLSGPAVRFGLETVAGAVPAARRATLAAIRSRDGEILDRGLVLFFPGPDSFTGEDVAELHLHGGRAVVQAVLAELAALPGFRPAVAGEFTRRAFQNRKVDLTQVEGLADLVAAETDAQRRQALRQASGDLGRLYEGWRERLVRARALLDAELDFADEDDVPGSVSVQAWDIVRGLLQEIVNHVDDRRGERLRDGAEIVVLGPPNAGKSSLVNAIARRDVAIVTPEAGTTRDLIEVRVDLGGYAATLVDTAGLREAEGLVEREGIRRAEARAAAADIVLWLSDVTGKDAGERPAPPGAIAVGTKIDLIDRGIDSDADRSPLPAFEFLVSAKTGEGIDALLTALAGRLTVNVGLEEPPLVTRARHRAALIACRDALLAALSDDGRPLELRAEDLRAAGDALARITGRIDVEDMLDVIFRDFCIGK